MTNFTARFAGVATLALAVLPVAALTTAAHAETHVPAAVRVADLNMARASDRARCSPSAPTQPPASSAPPRRR